MNETSKQLIDKITTIQGKEHTVLHCVEELSELQKVLLKNINRGKNNRDEILDEMVDVYILLEAIKKFYDFSDDEIWNYLDNKILIKLLPQLQKLENV